MKKRKSELIKIQNIIENNRINLENNFLDLMISDVSKLLKDYFVFNKSPDIQINKTGGELFISINLTAVRVKSFTNVPR